MLHEEGILSKDAHSSFKDFTKGTVEQAIINDDVEKLITLSAEPKFKPLKKITITNEHSIFYVTKDVFMKDDYERNVKINYLQLMAYYGSVKCFKFALIKGIFDEKSKSKYFKGDKINRSILAKYAIAGGNEEIINTLKKEICFNRCFGVAIKYNRYNLCDWLIEDCPSEKVGFADAAASFNRRAFFFNIKNDIDNISESYDDIFNECSEIGDIETLKYISEVKKHKK